MSLNWLDILFIAAGSVQLLLWLFLFSLPIRKKSSTQTTPFSPPISIVICARNEINNLRQLLPALLDQVYDNFEIIVVDDRSTDQTNQLMTLFPTIKILRIETTPQEFNAKKYALKTGINHATHEYILVTDADCLPSSNQWLSSMAAHLSSKKEIVLGLSPYFISVKNKILNQIIQFETTYSALQMSSLTLAGFPYMGLGRNMLYHKKIFNQSSIALKNKHLIGGDDDLLINEMGNKTNTTINLSPESFVFSYPKTSFLSWLKQKKRHLSVSVNYSFNSTLILLLINLSQAILISSLLLHQYLSISAQFIIVAYVLRTSLLFVIFDRVCKDFKGKINPLTILIGDILYPFYLFTLGILSIVFKTNTWK